MAGSPSEQKQVGKYAVLRTLGRGGAGVVYECLDPDLDRSVAIKTLLPAEDAEGAEHLRRFKTEAQALARLAHQNIVRVYDYDDRTESYPFIVMEFVEGGSLRQVLDPVHPMAPDRAVALVRQVLAGLAATHRIGVIHRDIKPGNILMRGDHALIADFGIARIADKRSTMVGTVIGTAHYMAPEQLLGGDIDHRADIWSSGVLLYQALTGRLPFDGSNALAIMEAIRITDPRPPSEINPAGGISGALDQVVLRSLAKRPDDRYASAEEFSQALAAALNAPSEADRTIVMGGGSSAASTSSGASATGGVRPTVGAVAGAAGNSASGRSSALRWVAAGGGVAVLAGIGVGAWMLTMTPTPVPIQRPVDPPPGPSTRLDPTGPATPGPPRPSTPDATPQGGPVPVTAPPIAPQPQVPVQQEVKPPQPVEPQPPPAPRLADLRNLADAADCAVVGGSLEPGRLILSGVGAIDTIAPMRSLWTLLRDADPAAAGPSRFDVAGLKRVGEFCNAMAILRPLAVPVGSTRRPVGIRLNSKGGRLRSDVAFSLSVAMPDFPGWVQLDYFSFVDNAVLHAGLMTPRVRQQPVQPPQAIQLNANEEIPVYNGITGSPGEDVVIAIVSRQRLFPQPRPETEEATTYLAALRAALASQPPGTVAAQVIPVIIEP